MAKPQQPELRRSERVPALSPDASEAVLSAETTPDVTSPDGPVPAEQRPGHHPEHEQDKPDLDAMAERLGVAPEGDEPDDAPHISPDDSVEEIAAQQAVREERQATPAGRTRRSKVQLTVAVVSPVVAYVVTRGVVRALRRAGRPLRLR